jgi:tubulin polyglutamylase TTLL6/13
MHLTNYSINKNSEAFVFNEDEDCDDEGHKRSLTSIYKLIESEGHDINRIKSDIESLIIKSFISV